MSKKISLWTNELKYEDWREDLESEYPDLTENQRYDIMYEINNDYLDDLRMEFSNVRTDGDIIIIADLGLWNGRRTGYRELRTNRIADCFYSEDDFAEWYIDEVGDLCCASTHHDGTNYLCYRAFKLNTTEAQRENLLSKIYDGTATRRDITRVTKRLGDEIAKVYGFKIYRGVKV